MELFKMLLCADTILIISALPFAVFAFVRYLRHKETMALAGQERLRSETREKKRATVG